MYSGEVFKANIFKPHEMVDLVFDKSEIQERKDLRQKTAILHARKTGKDVHKKHKQIQERKIS